MPLFNWRKRKAPAAAPALGGTRADPETVQTADPLATPVQEPPQPGPIPAAGTAGDPAPPPDPPKDPSLSAAAGLTPGAAGAEPVPSSTETAEQLPVRDPDGPGLPAPATVRATGEDGRIRWKAGVNHVPPSPMGVTFAPLHPPHARARITSVIPLPPAPNAPEENAPKPLRPSAVRSPDEQRADLPEESAVVPDAIALRLGPILKQLPIELETPEIRALRDSDTRVELPTNLVHEQLSRGRVLVSAATFASGLPEAERPLFQKLDPEAQIPIPLQEIFTRLPLSALRRRSDQVEDRPSEVITTPFTIQAEEDARRLAPLRNEKGAGDPRRQTRPQPAEPPSPAAATGLAPARPEILEGFAEMLTQSVRRAPEALQAIFLRDDVVDLPTALEALAQLPAVQEVALCDAKGERLAGHLDQPPGLAPLAQSVVELLELSSRQLGGSAPNRLESVSFHLGNRQVTGFAGGGTYLLVAHNARPFRPGVRETIQAFLQELVRLSQPEVPSP